MTTNTQKSEAIIIDGVQVKTIPLEQNALSLYVAILVAVSQLLPALIYLL